MKPVKVDGKLDLSGWALDAIEELRDSVERTVLEAAQEIVEIMFEGEAGQDGMLVFISPSKPTEIAIVLGSGDDLVEYTASLRELLLECIKKRPEDAGPLREVLADAIKAIDEDDEPDHYDRGHDGQLYID